MIVIDFPTSRAQNCFSEARKTKKTEREARARVHGPATGTGNEKRRTFAKVYNRYCKVISSLFFFIFLGTSI